LKTVLTTEGQNDGLIVNTLGSERSVGNSVFGSSVETGIPLQSSAFDQRFVNGPDLSARVVVKGQFTLQTSRKPSVAAYSDWQEGPVDHLPNFVRSDLSGRFTQDGLAVDVEIYRFSTDPKWFLEVVDHAGGSTVWDDPFESDEDALAAFHAVLADEGIGTFSGRKIIPFATRS